MKMQWEDITDNFEGTMEKEKCVIREMSFKERKISNRLVRAFALMTKVIAIPVALEIHSLENRQFLRYGHIQIK